LIKELGFHGIIINVWEFLFLFLFFLAQERQSLTALEREGGAGGRLGGKGLSQKSTKPAPTNKQHLKLANSVGAVASPGDGPPLLHAQLREAPPQAVELLQSLILRVGILVNAFEGTKPCCLSILKDSFPDEITGVVNSPLGLIEYRVVPFDPNAPKNNTPNKSPDMANLAKATRDGTSENRLGPVGE
jgi:hypothetical protein